MKNENVSSLGLIDRGEYPTPCKRVSCRILYLVRPSSIHAETTASTIALSASALSASFRLCVRSNRAHTGSTYPYTIQEVYSSL